MAPAKTKKARRKQDDISTADGNTPEKLSESNAPIESAARTDSKPQQALSVSIDPDATSDGEDVKDKSGRPEVDDADGIDAPTNVPRAVSFEDWIRGAALPKNGHYALGLVIPILVMMINARRVSAYTVDDAFISFRYARNLANGDGLVYNVGERVEGFTNFLWTLIMAVVIKFGGDPVAASKLLGCTAAACSMVLMFELSNMIRPMVAAPSIGPWLAASTIVFSGYAVYGLETAFFGCMLLLGTYLFFRETNASKSHVETTTKEPESPNAFPWSGVVFGLAGLTRPEAPAFVGLLMLALVFGRGAFGEDAVLRRVFTEPRGMFGKQNLIRAALFVVPVLALVAFRYRYYGHLVPNTFLAKTGNVQAQIPNGINYVRDYFNYAGPALYVGLLALVAGILRARRDILALVFPSAFVVAYCILIGGDWMEYFRQMAPFEIFAFILVDVSVRSILERKSRTTNVALVLFLAIGFSIRFGNLQVAQRKFDEVDGFWKKAPRGIANWMINRGVPGEIAMGDIGYVGYATNYPILDTLGLVDPVIGGINRGYKRNFGAEFLQYVFEQKKPRYIVLIVARECTNPVESGSQFIYRSRQFQAMYTAAGKVPSTGDQFWCIYERKDLANPQTPPR